MVIDHCTLNIEPCMIHFCVRSKILVKMMYKSYIETKSLSRYIAISSFNFSAPFDIGGHDSSSWLQSDSKYGQNKIAILAQKCQIGIFRKEFNLGAFSELKLL